MLKLNYIKDTTIWGVATDIPFKVLMTWSARIQYESSFGRETSADPGEQDVFATANVDLSEGTCMDTANPGQSVERVHTFQGCEESMKTKLFRKHPTINMEN